MNENHTPSSTIINSSATGISDSMSINSSTLSKMPGNKDEIKQHSLNDSGISGSNSSRVTRSSVKHGAEFEKESMDRIKLLFGDDNNQTTSDENNMNEALMMDNAQHNNNNAIEDKFEDDDYVHHHYAEQSKNQKSRKSTIRRQRERVKSINANGTKVISNIISGAKNSRARLKSTETISSTSTRWKSKKNRFKKQTDENSSNTDGIANGTATLLPPREQNNRSSFYEESSANNNITTHSAAAPADSVPLPSYSDNDDQSASSISSRESRRKDIMMQNSNSFIPYPSDGASPFNIVQEDDASTHSATQESAEKEQPVSFETQPSPTQNRTARDSHETDAEKISHCSLPSLTSHKILEENIDPNDDNEQGLEIFATTDSMKHSLVQTNIIQNLATEHRIYLCAILAILTEKDTLSQLDASTTNSNLTYQKENIIISGPLKKASHIMRGVWRVKYAEVRRGLFTYYEDSISTETTIASTKTSGTTSLKKKSLPLRASTTTCRAVKVTPKSLNMRPSVDCTQDDPTSSTSGHHGAVFELTIEGGPRRLWLTTCREERQAWIHAIHNAMIGSISTFTQDNASHQRDASAILTTYSNRELIKMGVPLHYNTYQSDILAFLSIQKQVKASSTINQYKQSLTPLVGKQLTVPVQWIKEQIEVAPDFSTKKFKEESITMGISQLWKDLLRDSVSINSHIYQGDTGHGPERIIGALSRCILEFDETSTSNTNKSYITPKQAVIYARDILLACNRTRSGGDSYYCIDNLCTKSDLMFLCPYSSEAEPLTIRISHVTNDDSLIEHDESSCQREVNYMMWIKSKPKSSKIWRKFFFVLSQSGVLSFYEKQHPRPHNYKGQVVLEGSSMVAYEVPLDASGTNTLLDGDIFEMNNNPPSSNIKGTIRKAVGNSKRHILSSDTERSSGRRSSSVITNKSNLYLIILRPADRSKDRKFLFDDFDEFHTWKNALETVLSSVNDSNDCTTFQHAESSGQQNSRTKLSSEVKQFILNRSPFHSNNNSHPSRHTELLINSPTHPRHHKTNSADLGDIQENRLLNERKPQTEKIKSEEKNLTAGEELVSTDCSNAPNEFQHLSITQRSMTNSATITHPLKEIPSRQRSSLRTQYQSTVKVEVEAATVYKISTLDPDGDEHEDTWFTLQTIFSQSFRLCGGQNGRLFRGDEVVRMNFLPGLANRGSFLKAFSEKQFPRELRRRSFT